MTAEAIQIRGARQNNLCDVSVTIPRGRLVAVTGVSGSGKSSLAFDTLFREGQRRFLETLSAYARQFLGRMEKPDVDLIEGLSPAIAVDQKAIQRGPRSTVGTITEIVDHLRVLYARAGTAHCPEHQTPLSTRTAESICREIIERFDGQAIQILAPLVRDRKGQHKALFADLRRKGFVRARVDGTVSRLEEVVELGRYHRHTIEVVIDRLKIGAPALSRLREGLDGALELGSGDVCVLTKGDEKTFSTQRTCPRCRREAPPLEPRLFSFNSPHGACPTCAGMGLLRRPSSRLVVSDPALSIEEGALAVTRAGGGALLFPRVDFRFLRTIAEASGFDLTTPWEELAPEARRTVLRGCGERRFPASASWSGRRHSGSVKYQRRYRGVLPSIERAWRKGQRKKQLERFLEEKTCKDCKGTRLLDVARAVRFGEVTLPELLRAPVGKLQAILDGLQLSERETQIGEGLLHEIRRRIAFLCEVGLSYLSLDRSADTLSGGEAQRIRLAAQLGAGLQDVLYVLDEPSVGLHARDHGRLFGALEMLRDGGNTIVVVEHDEATLRSADWLIDIGPGPGKQGGRVVAAGPPGEVARADSPTGQLLRGELTMPKPAERRPGNGKCLRLHGASGFNLKKLDVSLPLGALTVVSGVSGSGKSTLIHHTLQRAVTRHLGREAPPPLSCKRIEGLEHIEELVFLSSAPIGRTPRSNPATYTGAFTPIRDLYARMPEARMRGWAPGRFSFNVAGGRCEGCQGAGAKFVELQFLAPVTVPCGDCGGHRFQQETLQIHYRGHSIADVLGLSIQDAVELFRDHPKIVRPLAALVEVGLGYLSLGQPSTTLSGGEAQRVKLAKHLQRRSRKHTLYLLDEPTTGLHNADVQRLLGALQRLVDQGHSVCVIEHMLDVIRAADHVIDLGPEGGAEGGYLVCAGTPEEIQECEQSHTAAALFAEERLRAGSFAGNSDSLEAGKLASRPRKNLDVIGARTHNLRNIDVSLPRGSLTVVTGPSGSGKSSLALDTIHATGRQRFVESLSTYARQFLASRERAPVERIDGLGPSIAVEARTSAGHPRSTVATTTEIHDHLRVLWARAGTRRCPEHGEKLVQTDASGVARRIVRDHKGQRGWIAAPIFGPGVGEPDDLEKAFISAVEEWRKAGFVRVLMDGLERRLDDKLKTPAEGSRIDLVIDRLALDTGMKSRIAEAVEQAEALSGGRVSLLIKKGSGDPKRIEFSTRGACTRCGFRLEEDLEPRHFSFNVHVGACPSCDGLGQSWQCNPEKLVTRAEFPLVASVQGDDTAIPGKLGRYLTKGKGYYEFLLRTVAGKHKFDLSKPFEKLSAKARDLFLFGKGARKKYTVHIDRESASFELHQSFTSEWHGLCGHVNAWHGRAEDPEWREILEAFMSREPCAQCNGERLAPGPRSVTVSRKRLPEVLALTVTQARAWLMNVKLAEHRREAVEPVREELGSRLSLLEEVGLGYLTLDRAMGTLSGGEARRVRLSASLGSNLVGVCYVLDEPTVGLHPADVDRLTNALFTLRDGGNTVIVVEHDESLIRRADYVLDMGPGAGRLGGELVAGGTPAEVMRHPDSLTAKALRGELPLVVEEEPVPAAAGAPRFTLSGAKLHNLKSVSFAASFGRLNGVCGPSGSGKSTLIMEVLVPALRGERPNGRWRSLRHHGAIRPRLMVVDAAPIGKSPKSIPATAVGLLDPLRELFTRTPEARMRGYKSSHFSFNSSRGRCPVCEGRGASRIEMQFLADLWLECEECDGKRYRPEILDVRYRGRSIADVLGMTIDEAAEFLAQVPALARILETLRDVGLGYLGLGQSSTTLSSGEAQRIKLAGELSRTEGLERSIIILDEPTTGLSKSDVTYLYRVLRRLTGRGDCVIVIEHHTDLLAACDALVELGPAGGLNGGRVIAKGSPDELCSAKESVTGPWLAAAMKPGANAANSPGMKKRKAGSSRKVAS
jgi:excinuclease ABC subunit A